MKVFRYLKAFRDFSKSQVRAKKGLYAEKQKLGRKAEKDVRSYLRSNGYIILKSNYSTSYGEIDIIALRKKTIAFVEVRSGTARSQIKDLRESVDCAKQKKIISAAHAYISRRAGLLNEDFFLRFDVAAVVYGDHRALKNLSYCEDAFRAPG